MKKQISNVVIVLTLFFSFSSANAQRVDTKDKDLIGRVECVYISSYTFTQSFGETLKGSLKDNSEYTFDKAGNFIDVKEEGIRHIYKNQYRQGKLMSQDILNNGVLLNRIKYSYTPTGYIQTTYKSDGSEYSKKVKKGNIITATGESSSISYLNAKGKEYKIEATAGGIMDVTSSTKYNPNGNPISTRMSLSAGGYSRSRVITYKSYKYDKHKNWIYREKYQDGSPDVIEEREITYYSTK